MISCAMKILYDEHSKMNLIDRSCAASDLGIGFSELNGNYVLY